ncbi:TonB-dependent receptor [Phenylobacterium immobile]|uniref:TonB-dependent receptor n=1 Tax=Phenylobacterium immobile TaxID=21 RepID=UPI000AB4F4F5|nr:TonB-dependent receptor [Phenylobacterium immobile]
MRRHVLLSTSCMLTLSATLLAPLAAHAAEEPADAGAITEIVVTAERRVQSVQTSSLAISVISPEQAKQAGVVQMRDLIKLEPGVQIGQGGPATQIYIRGVGDFGASPITNPAVATNIDGVYVSRANSLEGNFHDLERIEVLKGPQGTLYGRNASGGAINIITAKPRLGEVSGHMQAEVGNYRLAHVEGAFNAPIGDDIAVRAAFQIVSRDGYATMGFDDDHHEAIRLSGLWKPSDDFSLRLTVDREHVGGGRGPAYVFKGPPSAALLAVLNANGVSLPTDPRVSSTDPIFTQLYYAAEVVSGRCYTPNTIPVASNSQTTVLGPSDRGLCAPGMSAFFKPPNISAARLNNNDNNISAELNWNFGLATLTVIPAFRKVRNDYVTFPFVVYDDAANGHPEQSDTYSLEARLGASGPRLTWVAGAYFYRENQKAHAGGVLAQTVFSGHNETISFFTTESKAVFGQATYSLTEDLRLIAGGRYSQDDKTIDGMNVVYADPISFPFRVGGVCYQKGPICTSDFYAGAVKFKKFTYKVGTEFDLTPSNMLFVTYATGLKAGGFNQLSTAGGTRPGSPSIYRPENLAALEIGARNRFLDHRLQVNVELFRWKYKDSQQLFTTINGVGNPASAYTNAGQAHMYGGDIDVIAKFTPNDTLHVGVEYLKSTFDKFVYTTSGLSAATTGCKITPGAPFQTIDCSGKPLIRAPKYSGTASYTHNIDFDNGSSVDATISAQFAGQRYLGIDYTAGVLAKSYVAGDLFLTYHSPDRNWSLAGYVRNFNDAVIYTGSFTNPNLPSLYVANVAAPRTFGARLDVNF